MKKNVMIVFGMMCVGLFSFAGDGQYAVRTIPANLLKNAHVVKRFEEFRFEIFDLTKATIYHKYVLTILDENGDRFAMAAKGYNKKSHESPDINGRLFDANGVKIKSLKSSDVKDHSNVDESSLAEESRYKYHSFYHKVYPYTVEYEIEQRLNATMFFPKWDPVDYYNYAVEESRLTVICPASYALRFKNFNYPSTPTPTADKNKTVYQWQVKNFEPIEREYASGEWEEIAPMVYLAPTDFEMQGYKGNMATWDGLAKFSQNLRTGRDLLPEDIKKKVHQIADPLTDPRQKVEKLYEFMQQNTRYVSIQLGIGGWQPFDANYVATKRYGDCKALSNYMYALLKEINIPSFYTLISAGRGEKFFVPEFPQQQFNHVILCVPLKTDTVWLECTSQIEAPGYMGGFTEDRYALLVDENGGKLVKTPKYGVKDNLETRYTRASIDAEGHLTLTCKTDYKALQQDEIYQLINTQTREKVLEQLKKGIDLPQYDVVKFDYQQQKTSLPVVTENLDLTANSYAQVSGKRLFVTPNILTKTHRKLAADDTRKYQLVLDNEYWDIDTVEIKIPAGYQPESVPQPVTIDSKFGKYNNTVKVNADKITYYRSYQHFSGRFPASAYNELVKFYDQVYKADRNKVVMVKPE